MRDEDLDDRGAAPTRRRWLIAILVLAYLLRIGVALEYQASHPWADRPVIDEASYERWALEVASGDFVGDGVFFQEPLYPYALGLVFALADDVEVDEGGRPVTVATRRHRTAARHAQAFLGVVLVWLVHAVTRRAFGARAALFAALGIACYRPLLLMPSLLLKPNLFLPVAFGVVAAILAAHERDTRARWYGVGVLAGAAALLRGNALLLLPLVALAPFLLGGRRGAGVLLTLAGVATLLVPVALRNHTVGGVLALSTSGAGTNVYGGNAPENPYGIATEFPFVRGIPEHEAEDWRREAERRSGRSLDAGEVSRFWLGALGQSVADDPGGHALRLWRKLRLSLGAFEVPDNHDLRWDARYLTSLRVPLPGWQVWGTLGLAGLLLTARSALRARRWSVPAAVVAVAFVAYLVTIVLTVTSGRIRLMLVPLLVPFAAAFVDGLLQRGASEARPTRSSAALALVIAAVVVWTPVLPSEVVAEKLDGRDFNHVRVLLEDPDGLEEAGELALALAAKYPADPRVATLEAEVRFRRAGVALGRGADGRAEAESELRAAMVRLGPVATDESIAPKERFRARLLAGLCQLRAGGNPSAARRHLEVALDWDPTDRVGRLGLANALALEAESGARSGLDPGAVRARLEAARELVRGLRSEGDEPALADRERELDRALEGLP